MIDSHAHLEDEAFDSDRDEILGNLKKDGVDFLFNCGSSLKTSEESVELSKKYENVYAIVGVHPEHAGSYSEEIEAKIEKLTEEEKTVAIGEIGLDYHYDDMPSKEVQRRVFIFQLELAKKLQLPVVIHSRDAKQETFDILKAHKEKDQNFRCILHCYSGGVELMREYMKLGFFISLGGVTTFKNARIPKEVAKEVPIERLLLETDCPYMTPVPYRGKRNEPKYVLETAKYIAELRKISLEELLFHTDKNTFEFFGLKNA